MTDTHRITPTDEPFREAHARAAEEVVSILLNRLSAKQERKARAEIERFVAHLEATEPHLPGNVYFIRQRLSDLERQRAAEARRFENLRLAGAVRQIAAAVLS